MNCHCSTSINYFMAMRFELATQSVTSPNSENVAPLELQDSFLKNLSPTISKVYIF